MDFDSYQAFTNSTAMYPEAGTGSINTLTYLVLKLNGEAGECAEKLGKLIRDSGGVITDEFRLELLKEGGDVLWYISQMADELHSTLDNVAAVNVKKLTSRKERGVLGGSGDNR